MDFAELNRTRPDPDAMDVIGWSMNAQVHAFDDTSVMETLRGQPETVSTARSFCRDRPFALGPITLKPRFNPAATGPLLARPDALTAHVDRRQPTAFAAAWMAGSIAALASAGAESLTYFELVGMAGVMQADDDRPLFPAPHDPLFPAYHVLRCLTVLRGRPLLRCEISSSCVVAALATSDLVVLANLTPAPQRCLIAELPWAGARERAIGRHASVMRAQQPTAGAAVVELKPYAVTSLEPNPSAA